MNRKNFIKLSVTSGLAATTLPGLAFEGFQEHKQGEIPVGFTSIVNHLLSRDPGYWNTDWDGTMVIESLLEWKDQNTGARLDYAQKLFDHHVKQDNKLTDTELYNTFSGPHSRIIRGKYLPFTMYSGFFGLPFPCFNLFNSNGDKRAKQVCLDVANAILHQSARDQRGLVLHDDGVRTGEKSNTFTIPDTMYFVTKALMLASVLDKKHGDVFRKQALFQLKTGTSLYLDKNKNIARTVLYPEGVGDTFWCRASGWLSYALTGVLRWLPYDHPDFSLLAKWLEQLADGVTAYQGPNGGLRVLIDDTTTPEETSGTAMCLASIKEAVLKGWIPDRYDAFLDKGWDFVMNHVSDEGRITGIYTGWAIPAEKREIIIDQSKTERGWIPAVILRAGRMMSV